MSNVAEFKREQGGQGCPVDAREHILQENPDRYCMFPVHYDSMWRGYKKTETTFWTAEDVDLSRDPADWQLLGEGERSAVRAALGYLLAADRLLMENVTLRFLVDVEQPEARAFYSFQAFKQNIHAEALGQALAALVPEESEQSALFRAMRASPLFQRKVDWAKKWLMGEGPFAERLVAFAAVESIFCCSSFCSFFHLKRRGVLPGLSFANDMVSRDEGINVEFAGVIYSELQNKLSQERLHEILEQAVAIEKAFAADSEGGIGVEELGLKQQDMDKYIEFVADQLAATLGHERLYRTANPFDWLADIALKGSDAKLASLEAKTGGMSQAGVLKQVEARNYTLNFDEDF